MSFSSKKFTLIIFSMSLSLFSGSEILFIEYCTSWTHPLVFLSFFTICYILSFDLLFFPEISSSYPSPEVKIFILIFLSDKSFRFPYSLFSDNFFFSKKSIFCFLFLLFLFVLLFMAESAVYGSSQARGQIRAAATATQDLNHVCDLHHSSL